MRIDIVDQPIGVFAHLKEVRLFLCGLDLAAAIGAFAVHKLRRCEKRLAGQAIHAFVIPFIDIALVVHVFEDFLDLRDMIVVGCADKAVVGRAHEVPDTLDLARNIVNIFFRRLPGVFRLFFDLLAVLVRAGLQIDVVAFVALEPRNAVRENRLIGVADMRLSGCVGNRRRHIVFLSHIILSPCSCQYKKPSRFCQL